MLVPWSGQLRFASAWANDPPRSDVCDTDNAEYKHYRQRSARPRCVRLWNRQSQSESAGPCVTHDSTDCQAMPGTRPCSQSNPPRHPEYVWYHPQPHPGLRLRYAHQN